jgi:hypothetical protein
VESKNEFRVKNNFPSVTRRCRPVVERNLYRLYLSRLRGYRFEISAILRQLGWIDAPYTQNFEILKFGVKNEFFFHPAAILDFLTNFFSTKFAFNECKKNIEKLLDTLRVTSKNLILIRHFGSNRHFRLI